MIDKIFIEESVFIPSDHHEIEKDLIQICSDQGILKFEKDSIKWTYVGLIVYGDSLIYVLPKYYNGFDAGDKDYVTKCFRYYNKLIHKAGKIKDFSISASPFRLITSGIYGLYISLLQYYSNYGLYKPIKTKQTNTFDDSVNWNKTIETLNPVAALGSVAYFDVVSTRNESDNLHIITELQKIATMYAFEEFGKYLDNYSISLDAEPILDIYDKEFLYQILLAKLSSTFKDSEIHLIHLLIDFLNHKFRGKPEQVKLFGTTTFYAIWENACRTILGETLLIANYYRSAKWNFNDKTYKSVGRPSPDILKKS